MKLITIIIPIYNCEKFIDRCLNSIINQTYKNIEIILINDGSTDNSMQIIDKYKEKDNRIKVIDKKNEGVSASRNIGIELSNGEYITFVDADDWLELDAIEKMYNTIVAHNVDVVRANYFINKNTTENISIGKMYDLSNKVIKNYDFKDVKMLEYFLLAKNSIPNLVMLLLIKKEILKINNIKFDINLYMMEDVYFYLNLFLHIESIYYMDIPVYHYYQNLDSATKSTKKYDKNIKGIIEVNEKIRELLLKNNIFSLSNISKLNANHLKIITNYFYFLIRDKVENNKEIINKYIYLDEFQTILKDADISDLPLKNKIMIYLIKHNKIKMLFIFDNLVGYLAKILRK